MQNIVIGSDDPRAWDESAGMTSALPACARADGLERNQPRARTAVLIVSGAECDVVRLAQQLAQTNRGAVSVTLLGVGEGTSPEVTSPPAATVAVDYPAISEQIRKHLETRMNPRCAEVCNLPITSPAAVAAGACIGTAAPVAGALSKHGPCNPITVLIASARELMFKGLRSRFGCEQDVRVLESPVADPERLFSSLEQQRPKLLLLDERLSFALGRSLRTIRRKFPQVRVLLLADEMRHGLVEEILANRLDGLLLTGCPTDAYVKAIRAVDRGEIWLPRALLAKAVSELLAPHDPDPQVEAHPLRAGEKDALTRRETQIVALLSQGFTNKEIGRQLGIMEDTVKKHVQGVFGKLGIRRRTLVALRQAGQLNGPREAHEFPL